MQGDSLHKHQNTSRFPYPASLSSRKTIAPINRICQHTSTRSIVGISLITIYVKLVCTGGRLHMFVSINRLHPFLPPTSLLRLRPSSVRLQNSRHTKHPWSDLDIDKGEMGTKEEWARGVGTAFDEEDDGVF